MIMNSEFWTYDNERMLMNGHSHNNRSSGRHDMDEDDWDNNTYGGGSMHDPNDYYDSR